MKAEHRSRLRMPSKGFVFVFQDQLQIFRRLRNLSKSKLEISCSLRGVLPSGHIYQDSRCVNTDAVDVLAKIRVRGNFEPTKNINPL